MAKHKPEERKRPARLGKREPGDDNVTEATKREMTNEAVLLDAQVKTATAALRNHWKRVKSVGMNPADIRWYIQQMARPVSEIDEEMRRRHRLAWLMGLPIGQQLDMFSGPAQVSQINTAPQSGIDPYEQGRDAAKTGASWDTCPYIENSPQRIAWLQGHDDETGIPPEAA